jgi:hypothetical protein
MAVTPISSQARASSSPVRLESPNVAKAAAVESRVSDGPRGNFMLAHPQDEWMLTEGGELVPVIVPLSKSPGVQGVDRHGNFSSAMAYYLDRGFTLIPHDIIPGDYVSLYANRRGQKVHRSVFQLPLDGPNGTVWTFDGEAWAKFLRLLRAKGIVKAPRPHIVRGLLAAKIKEYEHLRPPSIDDASRRDAYERRVTMFQRQIEALKAELAGAIEAHGDSGGPVRNVIGGVLDAVLAEAEGSPSPAPVATRKGKVKPADEDEGNEA